MKKTLSLVLSVLMLVSCISLMTFAATDAPVITDGTANATGGVAKQNAVEHAVGATYVPDGTEWRKSSSDYREPDKLWTYDSSIEQLQLDNVSNNEFPTITVNQADGSTVDLVVYGSRAVLSEPTRLTKFSLTFDTAANKGAKAWLTQFDAKLYASVDGETWDVLYSFIEVTTLNGNTAGVLDFAVTSDKAYNYVALYTETKQAGLCRLISIIPYGYTDSNALSAKAVDGYGQVSVNNDKDRPFFTQQNIWENTDEVQYHTDNFTAPQILNMVDGTTATGYGAIAKLGVPSTVSMFEINRFINTNSTAWGQYWDDMTLYGSTDGGNTWSAIAKPTDVADAAAPTTHHAFPIYEEFDDTVFTHLAMLTVSQFRISQVIAYGIPTDVDGEVLSNMKTIDDGTRWVSKNDDVGAYREPSDVWEVNNKVFQFQSANVFELGAMGLGAAAKLEYPTKLTGFKIDFDMQSGREFWKDRANYVSVYASVDGNEWVKLHTLSGVTQSAIDYVINVNDDTLYNYVGIYTSNAALGIRLKNVAAYGEANGEAMTLRGYQTKTYTDKDGVARSAVRFVATIDEAALNNQTLGFEIVADYVKAGVAGQQTFDVTTECVYRSIIANGETLTMDDIAKGSGHEYIVLGTVMDINRANYDYVDFKVTPYVIKADGEKIYSAPGAITHATGYPYSDWTINGNSIKDYTIVYDADGIMQSTVEAFRDKLAELSGYTLNIATSDAAETDLEILIGETGRSATATVTRPLALNYTIATSGNKLVVRTGGEHSLELLMADFFNVVKCGMNEALAMGADYSVSGDYYDDPYNNKAMVSGADIRTMSANVLLRSEYKPQGDYFYDCEYPELNTYEGGSFEFDRRVEIFMAALDYYGADVIGVQEFCFHWVDAVNAYINATDNDNYANWKIVVFDTWNTDRVEKDRNACSGIIYRTDKLTMTDSGMTPYSVRNNERGQCITWADFTVTATDETFTFVSTHWGAGEKKNTGVVIEELQAAELTAFVNAKKETGATTVITTGDFNQNEDSNTYNGFLTNTGSIDAKTSATKKINSTGSWHEWAGTTNSAGSCDHITATGGSALTYETIFYNQQIYGSDHAWIVSDLAIGG